MKLFISALLLVSLFINKNTFGQSNMRPLTELTADTSGWRMLNESIKSAKNSTELLPVASRQQAAEALFQTQVTTRSYMGAIVYFTGGILVDNGWIRLLGSGSDKLPRTLPGWNKGKTFKEFGERPGYLLIADDAIGGFFALNGGELGADVGMVYYLAPETLKWESLGRGYSDFVDFCLNGDLAKFYQHFRWKNWQNDTAVLNGNSVYNFYPFLWTKEGKDISKTVRKIVSVQEQYQFNRDAMKEL